VVAFGTAGVHKRLRILVRLLTLLSEATSVSYLERLALRRSRAAGSGETHASKYLT
jgi:hypothetical protein